MSILIITNNNDHVTDYVIDWILSFNKNVFRLTFEDFLRQASVTYDFSLTPRLNIEINGVRIKSGWLRKVTIDKKKLIDLENVFGFKDGYEIYRFLINESSVIKQIILNGKYLNWLCDYKSVFLNKIEVLELAEKYRLRIPKSTIVNNVKELKKFIHRNKIEQFIIKSIGENLSLLYQNQTSLFQPVKGFLYKEIEEFPNKFAPTLVQEEIKKKSDVRVLFLDNCFYSMAIEATEVDCRLDNIETKYYPIKLPEIIEDRLKKLMAHLNLNYGSIDLIIDQNNNFYFLEITPTGEFSSLSQYCNYEIEEKIANFLCNGD